MFHIVADSGCDLFTLSGASFCTVPLTIHTDARSFTDDEKLDTREMIDFLLSYKGRSTTACPSTESWLDAFSLAYGRIPEEIYVVTLTSSLSGTYNSACVARDLFLEKHPETKILIIDSLSVGPEMRLILEKLVEFKNAGLSFEEVREKIQAYSASTRLFFAFRSVHNLAANGRIPKLAASAAGLLKISIYGTASSEGTIAPLGKLRGDKKVLSALLSELEKAGYRGGKVRITHAENEDLAEKLLQTVAEKYPAADLLYAPVRGLCSYYCERGGICIACETV